MAGLITSFIRQFIIESKIQWRAIMAISFSLRAHLIYIWVLWPARAVCLKFYGFDVYINMSVLCGFNALKLFACSEKRDDLSALAHSSFYFKHFDLMNNI